MCCSSKPLVKSFLNLFESFDFLQCVSDPHKRGLSDLVLSLGFSVGSVKIADTVFFSDHKTVLFSCNFPCGALTINVSASVSSCVLTLCTASRFSAVFEVSPLITLIESPSPCMGLEELVNQFNSSCLHILDVVAPFEVGGEGQITALVEQYYPCF